MRARGLLSSVDAMNYKTLPWTLILGLGSLALIRPVLRMTGVADGVGTAVVALASTAVITVIWVLVVGLSRLSQPIVILVAAGVAYSLLAVVLSAIASPVIDGELRGPLANPISLLPLVLLNALWGFVAGCLAAGLQRLAGRGPISRDRSRNQREGTR